MTFNSSISTHSALVKGQSSEETADRIDLCLVVGRLTLASGYQAVFFFSTTSIKFEVIFLFPAVSCCFTG